MNSVVAAMQNTKIMVQCRLISQLVEKDMRNLSYNSQNYIFQGCEKRTKMQGV